MHNKDELLLQKAAARVALDKGSLRLDQYKKIINKVTEIEEQISYEKKLRDYKMDEAKNKILKNSLLSV
jgi:alcohol dehydrogenase class IV